MYLYKADAGIQALYQAIYDGWFNITGNTNFGLSRGCFLLGFFAWFVALYVGGFDLHSSVFIFAAFCFGISVVWNWNKAESRWSLYLDNPMLNVYAQGHFMAWGLIRLWLFVVLIADIAAIVMPGASVGVSLLLSGRDVLLISMFYFAACTPREAGREVARPSYALLM